MESKTKACAEAAAKMLLAYVSEEKVNDGQEGEEAETLDTLFQTIAKAVDEAKDVGTKPWTVGDPPSPPVNDEWTDEEIERCVAAANDALERGKSEQDAIFACIGAAGKGEKEMEENGINSEKGEIESKFVSSPRNRYGTHSSFGFKGDYAAAWRCHFSQVGGGATTANAAGPIRGTVRRTEMIAAAMKPACNLPDTESIGPRKGPKSPLKCSFPKSPGDYGLSKWDKLEGEEQREKARLSCSDLAVIKRAALAEVKRRANDREAKKPAGAKVGYLRPGVFKSWKKDGRAYWMAISSSAFEDREEEIVSRKALDYANQFADVTGMRGHLNLYHLPNVKLGICDIMMRVDKVQLEAGRWVDNEYSNAVRRQLETNPALKGEGQPAVSLEFWFDEEDRHEGVYDQVIIFNRALLKLKHAANPDTWFRATEDLKDTEEMSTRKDVIDFLGSEELADRALKEADELSKRIEEVTGKRYKELDMSDELEVIEDEEAAEEIEETTDDVAEETEEAEERDIAAEEPTEDDAVDEEETIHEVVFTEEALSALAEDIAEVITSKLGLKELFDTVDTLSATVEGLARDDDEKIDEKIKRLPRAKARKVVKETDRAEGGEVEEKEIVGNKETDEGEGTTDKRAAFFKDLKAIGS